MAKIAFAVAAHPDDIEFMMAGTLLLLGRADYELHCMTIANGSCGSETMGPDEAAAVRTEEARAAAKLLGAEYHEPLVGDLEIYYTPELTTRMVAVVRRINPEILLVPSLEDYMEDHTNAARLAVTAAFCRGMRNYVPDCPIVSGDVAIYHAMPAGLTDPLRRPIIPDFCVDITSVLKRKRDALACHRSQMKWLEASQGMDSYLQTMEDLAARVGAMSGRFRYAEGWQRHTHLGFGPEEFDPLRAVLPDEMLADVPPD